MIYKAIAKYCVLLYNKNGEYMENKTTNNTIKNSKQTIQRADQEQLENIAKRILKKNKRAFEVLGK